MSSRRRGKSKKKDQGKEKKNKDLWVKLLEARVKARKAREQKIDDDLEKLLSGGGEEQKEAEAAAAEGKTEDADAPKGDAKPDDKAAADAGADGKAKADAASAEAAAAADAARREADKLITNADKCKESIVLFVGSKGSGQSTQIQMFLNPKKTENPKPTTALEYTFGRKATGNIKSTAHIWELGGGLRLRSMLPVVIKPSNMTNLRVVIVLDLSQPGDVIPLLEAWLKLIRQNVSAALTTMKKDKKMQRMAKRLENQALANWVRSPDMDKIDVVPVPILVLCTKLDVLSEQSTVKRKSVLNAIRYLCLCNGAACVTTDHKTKMQLQYVRSFLNNFGFGVDFKGKPHLDAGKCLVVPAGADSFAAIGIPTGADKDVYNKTPGVSERLNMWRKAIELHFDPTGIEKDTDVKTEEMESHEPIVDAMVERKQEQLVQYRKEVERRRKLAASEAKKRR